MKEVLDLKAIRRTSAIGAELIGIDYKITKKLKQLA